MCKFDTTATNDPDSPTHYRIRRSMLMEDLVKQIATDISQDYRRVRLWLMVNRQNKTIRPDQPIMDLEQTVEEVYARSAAHRDNNLRVWAEIAVDTNADGEPIWPSYQSLSSNVTKEDMILLLLKYFDVEKQTLQGISHVYLSKDKKVEDLIPLIHKAMSWEDGLPANQKLLLWEVSWTS